MIRISYGCESLIFGDIFRRFGGTSWLPFYTLQRTWCQILDDSALHDESILH